MFMSYNVSVVLSSFVLRVLICLLKFQYTTIMFTFSFILVRMVISFLFETLIKSSYWFCVILSYSWLLYKYLQFLRKPSNNNLHSSSASHLPRTFRLFF